MEGLLNYDSWEEDNASVATCDSRRQGKSEDDGSHHSEFPGDDEGDDQTHINEESVISPEKEVGISRSEGGEATKKRRHLGQVVIRRNHGPETVVMPRITALDPEWGQILEENSHRLPDNGENRYEKWKCN